MTIKSIKAALATAMVAVFSSACTGSLEVQGQVSFTGGEAGSMSGTGGTGGDTGSVSSSTGGTGGDTGTGSGTGGFGGNAGSGGGTGGNAPVCIEGETQPCYTGDPLTEGIGECHAGVKTCVTEGDGTAAWGPCEGELLPTQELCHNNGKDQDCDGNPDNGCECHDGDLQSCYTGDPSTEGVGICHSSINACWGGQWGVCPDQTPLPNELCGTELDEDCDGETDEEPCSCAPGSTQSCYTGPAGTAGIGSCKTGVKTCTAEGAYGPCEGETLPSGLPADTCSPHFWTDDNCNGIVNEGCCGSPCPVGICQTICINGFCGWGCG